MGCFSDLPKDVVWLILREALFRQREDWSLKGIKHAIETVGFSLNRTIMLLSVEDLEKRVFDFENDGLFRYFNWLCNFALINRKCLTVIKSKTKRIAKKGFTFIPGSLTNRFSEL